MNLFWFQFHRKTMGARNDANQILMIIRSIDKAECKKISKKGYLLCKYAIIDWENRHGVPRAWFIYYHQLAHVHIYLDTFFQSIRIFVFQTKKITKMRSKKKHTHTLLSSQIHFTNKWLYLIKWLYKLFLRLHQKPKYSGWYQSN